MKRYQSPYQLTKNCPMTKGIWLLQRVLSNCGRRVHFVAPLMLTLAMAAAASAGVQATFFVAPNGNDNNPGTEAGPFATIEKARQTVRTINKEMAGDIVVPCRHWIHYHRVTMDKNRPARHYSTSHRCLLSVSFASHRTHQKSPHV